ncbi:MAG: hypothetical protein K6A67_06385 [Bacteroidales bacterium]|nr:hypothetical protein [Bacteroidales bacterium]
MSGHFGRFSANVEDHLLKLYMPDTITLDEISEYRKKIDKQKDALYGSWKHDAIEHYLVHSSHQDESIACISQLKNQVVHLFGGHGTRTLEELKPILDDYKDCSQYDISLEGQRERWDILLYLDLLYDKNHQPGQFRDEFYEGLLKDVEDLISQIGGELVRSVSYQSYIERLTELVTKHLPSSETAQHYLNTLPAEAFNYIRQQLVNFPHHLYYLFRTNPEEFVRTIYYARIPRKYLDPFLSGIALVEAYDKKHLSQELQNQKSNMIQIGDYKLFEISSEDDLKDGKIAEKIRKIITSENNVSEIMRFESKEACREYIGTLNNQLRNYTKMAENFLKIKSTRDKVDSLRGLVQLIEKECNQFLVNDSLVEWDYEVTDSDTGVSREITGPPDYEIYASAFNNKEKRRQLATMLECSPFKEQGIVFAELEIFVLHTAIKVELERAEKEFSCQTCHDNLQGSAHFSKRVSNDELKVIYNDLMEHKMLCDNPTSDDFIYWHTGSGTRPLSPMKWAIKNVCHYYVKLYLDSDWSTAEQCFSCKKGKIINLISANNTSDNHKKIIDEILKKARKIAANKTTKTD